MANDLAITDSVIADERLYNVNESARALGGLSPYTIHTWLSKGKLRRTKVGARTMIRGSELKRILVDGGKSAGRPRQTKQGNRPPKRGGL